MSVSNCLDLLTNLGEFHENYVTQLRVIAEAVG